MHCSEQMLVEVSVTSPVTLSIYFAISYAPAVVYGILYTCIHMYTRLNKEDKNLKFTNKEH